jgi:hypothetical protein
VVFIARQQSRTLPLAIRFLPSDQYFDIGMLATLSVLGLYLFLSEWFVQGMTSGAIKGRRSTPHAGAGIGGPGGVVRYTGVAPWDIVIEADFRV